MIRDRVINLAPQDKISCANVSSIESRFKPGGQGYTDRLQFIQSMSSQ